MNLNQYWEYNWNCNNPNIEDVYISLKFSGEIIINVK